MSFLAPPDGPEVVYEAFAPFAHVPGRYEWCRILSPTHGEFDVFIALDPRGTSRPADVYVADAAGARFMADRYPECRARRVPPGLLRVEERDGGRVVVGTLHAPDAPLVEAEMTLTALPGARPQQRPYGGTGAPVWGSRFTCWGVDLELPARADGHVRFRDGRVETFAATPAVVTLASFGRIAPREDTPRP